MEGVGKNNSDLNSSNLLVVFYNFRKPLIITTLVAFIISLAISFLLKAKYESTVVLFPTTTNSISKALLVENTGRNDDILKFGEEEEVEQVLQILNSDEIRDRITKKYNLIKHYGIEDDAKYKETQLRKKYESNVTFKGTKFMSIEINVLDYDPDTAALIANDIAALLDTVKNRMRKEIATEALEIVQDEYNGQVEFIRQLDDSLRALRNLGIINVRAQTERLTEQMAIAILEGKKNAAEILQIKLDTISKYSGVFTSIQDQITLEQKRLVLIRSKYKEAEVDATKSLQHKFIVNTAFPAEKSTYPIKWLIILVCTITTFFMTLVALLFKESLMDIKSRLK